RRTRARPSTATARSARGGRGGEGEQGSHLLTATRRANLVGREADFSSEPPPQASRHDAGWRMTPATPKGPTEVGRPEKRADEHGGAGRQTGRAGGMSTRAA